MRCSCSLKYVECRQSKIENSEKRDSCQVKSNLNSYLLAEEEAVECRQSKIENSEKRDSCQVKSNFNSNLLAEEEAERLKGIKQEKTY